MGGGGGKTRGKKKLLHRGQKKNPKPKQKKQSLGIIKNYLNHPQHTRLDPDSAFSRPQSETQALTGLRDQSRLAWLPLANQQLKSMKKKYTAIRPVPLCLAKTKTCKILTNLKSITCNQSSGCCCCRGY